MSRMLRLQVVPCGSVYEYAVFSKLEVVARGEAPTEAQARSEGETLLTSLGGGKTQETRQKARVRLEMACIKRKEMLVYVLAAMDLGREVAQVVAQAQAGEVLVGKYLNGSSWIPAPHPRKRTPQQSAEDIIRDLEACSRTAIVDGKVASTSQQTWCKKRFGERVLADAQDTIRTLFVESL